MADSVKIDPRDYKYFIERPAKDFNPEKNKAILNQTIKETTEFFNKLDNELDSEAGERLDVLASYRHAQTSRNYAGRFDNYVSRDLYNRLTGERVRNKLNIAEIARLKKKENNKIII